VKLVIRGLFCMLFTLTAIEAATADEREELIAKARRAAPAIVSANATVMYRGEVLAKGTNGWTCMPETLPDDDAPMCNDAVWMDLMSAMSAGKDYEVKKVGISYMLQGDAGERPAALGDVELSVIPPPPVGPDVVKRYAELGVSRLIALPTARGADGVLAFVERVSRLVE